MSDSGGTPPQPDQTPSTEGGADAGDAAFIAQVPDWVWAQQQPPTEAQPGQPQPGQPQPGPTQPPPPPWAAGGGSPVASPEGTPPGWGQAAAQPEWGPALPVQPALAWGQPAPVQPEAQPAPAQPPAAQPTWRPGPGPDAAGWGWGQQPQQPQPQQPPPPAQQWPPAGGEAYGADGETVVRSWSSSPHVVGAQSAQLDQTQHAAYPSGGFGPDQTQTPYPTGAPAGPPPVPAWGREAPGVAPVWSGGSGGPGGPRRPAWLVPLAAALAVLVALSLVFALVIRPRMSGDQQAAASTSSPVAATPTPTPTRTPTPTTTPTPSPTVDPADTRALALLGAMRHKELKDGPPKGQWVAVLAVRYLGIPDPTGATTVAGSKTFTPSAILDEYQRVTAVRQVGIDYGLLLTTDFAPRTTTSGRSGWVIYAFGPFRTTVEVTAYCKKRFPAAKDAELPALCAPTQLIP